MPKGGRTRNSKSAKRSKRYGKNTEKSDIKELIRTERQLIHAVDKYYRIKRDFLIAFIFLTTAFSLLLLVLFITDSRITNMTGWAPGDPQSTATRTFSYQEPLLPGDTVEVHINLDPNHDETYYALEEVLPPGAVITYYDDEGLDVYYDESEHVIRWLYLNMDDPTAPIPDIFLDLMYTVELTQAGTYSFKGEMMFEDDIEQREILGDVELEALDTCTDECEEGAIQCQDANSYIECGDFDSDSCLEWGTDMISCGSTQCNQDVCYSQQYFDYPQLNSQTRHTCQNTCEQDSCVQCSTSTGICNPESETCIPEKECHSSAYACGGSIMICHHDSEWRWGIPPAQENNCFDTYDNNCDGECDYDSSHCAHGDESCPVEILEIQVSESSPEEFTIVTVSCTVSVPDVNSVLVQGLQCSNQPVWNADVAEFQCNAGAYSTEPKTVLCTLNTDSSYQQGTDKEIQINVQPSSCTGLPQQDCTGTCEWCEECQDTMSNNLGGSLCVAAGNCAYECEAGSCGATCEGITSCQDFTECPDTCYDQHTLMTYEDIPYLCDFCTCIEDPEAQCADTGVQQPCGSMTCEDEYPGLGLTGSCLVACEEGACTSCDLSFPGTCECMDGLADVDGDPENGCEACDLPWVCTEWSQGDCGTRTCTCDCPEGVGCTGDHSENMECPQPLPYVPPPNSGSSPAILKGGSPLMTKGGSPILIKGLDECEDGYDNEGGSSNGCIDEDDYQCGGVEDYCWGGVDNDCDGDIDCDDSDCAEDDRCVVQVQVIEDPVYTVGDVLDDMFGTDPGTEVEMPTQVDSVAEVEVYFGFMNWLIIGVLAVLFLGLIFVQHIRPRLSGQAPASKMSAIQDYINTQRAKGRKDEYIRSRLKEVGWIDEVIDRNLENNRKTQ